MLMSWDVRVVEHAAMTARVGTFLQSGHENFMGHMDDWPHLHFTRYLLTTCDVVD